MARGTKREWAPPRWRLEESTTGQFLDFFWAPKRGKYEMKMLIYVFQINLYNVKLTNRTLTYFNIKRETFETT